MHPLAQALAAEFIRNFWSANHEIRWTAIEQEHHLWLAPDTVLVGRIDAAGISGDGTPFFADWKTASKSKARFMADEKARWRMNPQALTYGVLTGGSLFNVRWALKTDPPTTDFEWYTYTPAEVAWWRIQLLETAAEIRRLRAETAVTLDGNSKNWPLNLGNCTKYGEKYRCPHRDDGCWMLNFGHVPEGMTPRTSSHLDIEAGVREQGGQELVVLDATRTDDFMNCRELYRKNWEARVSSSDLIQIGGLREENENLVIGGDFHDLIAKHLTDIMVAQEKT